MVAVCVLKSCTVLVSPSQRPFVYNCLSRSCSPALRNTLRAKASTRRPQVCRHLSVQAIAAPELGTLEDVGGSVRHSHCFPVAYRAVIHVIPLAASATCRTQARHF